MRIGVFDSGLGGLSVLREIRRRIPAANLTYLADSAWVPYGARSEDVIRVRSLALSRYLVYHGHDMIVVACNTATAAAVPLLRETFRIPIVGMEPAVKPATAATRSGVVGVLATVGTLQSARFAALLDQFGGDIQVLTRACPGLVEQVEAGELDSELTRALVTQFVAPLVRAGADTLVLGCTHFPFLRPLIETTAGPDVRVIDTGEAVARRVREVAQAAGLQAGERGATNFFTSGDAGASLGALRRLWDDAATLTELPAEYAGRS
ncbi:glutamate racemase [Wenzhouxiangella sp. XN24]|uniref:glutamate racemase n=1 Tax=Wenzhouxiangella sp. XN24 TaxID=2713569 RepID=UPI001F0D90F1|nr:glutamate racemase [Wenzhouxiangella sp. XN24]